MGQVYVKVSFAEAGAGLSLWWAWSLPHSLPLLENPSMKAPEMAATVKMAEA
jgi:hypothetical protein